jgi:hypothetical protein
MKIIHKTRSAARRRAPVVHVDPMQLVILLLMQVEPAIGIGRALYSLAPACTVEEATFGKW